MVVSVVCRHDGRVRNINLFIDTLAAESRITCYEQKCLKATNMTHNKSICTDIHTYTDIY